LTFATADAFKYIHSPVFEDASKQKINGESINRPKRATWRLRRCGRVRMPYAAALLDLYTSVMSRQAFDLDFMSPGLDSAGEAEKSTSSPKPEIQGSVSAAPAEPGAQAAKAATDPSKK
ncbi:hypothetical protein LTR94_028313, partial [Friedmanniomyces endolithicus]